MAENLNYETKDSWCYGDNPDSCGKYGRFYTWEAAKTACRSVGWRLPDTADFNSLITAAGGPLSAGKLKAKSGWINNGNGTNELGFSALPGGWRLNGYEPGVFEMAGETGIWWAAEERDFAVAHSLTIRDYAIVYHDNKERGLSVRCLKN